MKKLLLLTLLLTNASLHATQDSARVERFDHVKHSDEASALFRKVFPTSALPITFMYPDVQSEMNVDVLLNPAHKILGLILYQRTVSSTIHDLHPRTYFLDKGTAYRHQDTLSSRVHPDHRNKGLGALIMKDVEKREASYLTDYLSLEPIPDAAPLYKRLGYVETHAIGTWPQIHGKSAHSKRRLYYTGHFETKALRIITIKNSFL